MKLIAYSNQLAENILFEAPENACTALITKHLEQLTGHNLHTIFAPCVSYCTPGNLPKKHAKKQLVTL